jgi:hypothetical protein
MMSRFAHALSRASINGGQRVAAATPPANREALGRDNATALWKEEQPPDASFQQTNGAPCDDADFKNRQPHHAADIARTTFTQTTGERREMDKDLHDDMLKLVRYKVLFVKREYEHAFPEREDLVSDNLDGSAFTAWKVAEFIQELGRGETSVPPRWREKGYPSGEHVRDGKLMGLKEEDKKYLRVYYEVLERYPREKFKYEEQQIRVLEEIRNALD